MCSVLPSFLIACSAAPISRPSDIPPAHLPQAISPASTESDPGADSDSGSGTTAEPQLERLIDDQVARIEEALAMKDPERCFGADALLTLSALAHRIEDGDQLNRMTAAKWDYARNMIEKLYRQCLDLENGEAVAKRGLSTIEEILGNHLFWMNAMLEKKSVRAQFSTPPCPIKAWPYAVGLAKGGGRGCIRLERPSGDFENRSCPKMFWRNKDAVVEIGVDARLTPGGYYRSELLLVDNCCNLETTNLSVRRQQNEIQVHLSSEGRDCFGGTAYWIKEEIYRLDLKNKKLMLIEEIPIFER